MYAIPITMYPIVPTSFRGDYLPRTSLPQWLCQRGPRPACAVYPSVNKEVISRRRAGRRKGRKTGNCRDSLHFQAEKDYMLNLLRIIVLRNSAAYRVFHHPFGAVLSFRSTGAGSGRGGETFLYIGPQVFPHGVGRGDFAMSREGLLVPFDPVRLVEVIDHEPGGLS